MKKLFVALVAVVSLFAARATTPIYVNDGLVVTAPQVDALAFVNNGTFSVATINLFRTQNTLSYTNRGSMQGQPGFAFEYENDFGKRSPALNFVHLPGADIQVFPDIFIGNENPYNLTGGGIVRASATNLTSRGLISAPVGGVIQLIGDNVNLSKGGLLDIRPVDFTVGGIVYTNTQPPSPFGYFNDVGISDVYWGLGEVAVNLSRLLQIFPRATSTNITVTTPIFPVGPGGNDQITLTFAKAYILTNSLNATNQLIQGIFLATHDTNITADASWAPSLDQSNPLNTAIVQFSTSSTNIITGNLISESLSLQDDLASTTNRSLLPNLGVIGAFRPLNYQLVRGQLSGFIRSNSPVTTNIFTQWVDGKFTNGMDYTNRIITNALYTAYAADMDYRSVTIPNIPNVSITNLAGKIDITAKNLNIEGTRMRAQGVVNIRAENLVSAKGVKIDSPYLYYDLGASNGLLRLEGLSQATVRRFGGFGSGFGPGIRAWSAIWTNSFDNTETNTAPAAAAGGRVAKAGRPRPQDPCPPGHDPISSTLDGMPCDPVVTPPGDTNGTPTTVTTHYEAIFHVLVVDCNLGTVQPVSLFGLTTRTNAEVVDVLNVDSSLQMLGEALTVNGELHVGGNIGNWTATNFPNLKYLTNNGYIGVPGAIHLGDDRFDPYESVIIRGTNVAYGQVIRSKNVEVTGIVQSFLGGVKIDAINAKLDEGADLEGSSDVTLVAGDLKARGVTIRSGGVLVLSVTNNLSDAGVISPNTFSAKYGYTLDRKPALGNLLGTTFEMNPPKFQEAVMSWAAEDRGADKAGYTDNAAIGHLILASETGGFLTINGPDETNGVYVDYLEISPNVLEDLENVLSIAPNTTLYFASANIPVDELDGRLDGRIRWVSNFTGPNSSVDVLLSDGRVVTVNKGFRDSLTVDTDGDGIANGYDLSPFDGVVMGITLVDKPPLTAVITWNAAANTTFTVQYATTLNPSDWTDLKVLANPNAGIVPLSVEDPVQSGAPRRYYRVVYKL